MKHLDRLTVRLRYALNDECPLDHCPKCVYYSPYKAEISAAQPACKTSSSMQEALPRCDDLPNVGPRLLSLHHSCRNVTEPRSSLTVRDNIQTFNGAGENRALGEGNDRESPRTLLQGSTDTHQICSTALTPGPKFGEAYTRVAHEGAITRAAPGANTAKLSKRGHPPERKDKPGDHRTDSLTLTAPTAAALRDRSRAIHVQVLPSAWDYELGLWATEDAASGQSFGKYPTSRRHTL